MAGPDEARLLPSITAAVRRAVSWFLGRTRTAADMAMVQAEETGMPITADTWQVPTPDEFDTVLFTDIEPELSTVFDTAYEDSITAEVVPVLRSEVQHRQLYMREVHDRLSQTQWPADTFESIRETLVQAADDGLSLQQTKDLLQPLLDPDTYDSWIERVAVTELHSAYNAGTYGAALDEQNAFGTPVYLTWLSTRDDRTRPAHRAAQGQKVQVGTPFIVGGAPLRWPGDPLGPPSQTIRCRCSTAVSTGPVTASGEPVTTPPPDRWEGPLAPLGTPTADGRQLSPPPDGQVRHRDLPLPLLHQPALADGHDGAVPVGSIDALTIRDDTVWGSGRFDLADPVAAEVARKVADGFAGGVSLDLDDATFELTTLDTGEQVENATDWRVMGATLTPHPAFAEARIRTAVQEDAMPEAVSACACSHTTLTASADLPVAPADAKADAGGAPDRILEAATGPEGEVNWDVVESAFLYQSPPGPDGTSIGDFKLPIADVVDGELSIVPALVDQAATDLDAEDHAGVPDDELADVLDDLQDVQKKIGTGPDKAEGVEDEKAEPTPAKTPAKGKNPFPAAISAAAGPLAPPATWFTNPGLTAPTPLTIGDDGRVYGHLAAWSTDGAPTCHTGSPKGSCIEVPRSAADYAFFHVGALRTDSGADVAVGNLIVDTDHAGPRADVTETYAHYADTGAAVAAVRAGEDAHGVWVAGSLLPHVTEEQVATLRRAPLSGDWRAVGGRLELVAALAVNTPGFPIPRARTDEYARVASLTAAGALIRTEDDQVVTAASVADAVLERLDARDRARTAASYAADIGGKAKELRSQRASTYAAAAVKVRRERAGQYAARATGGAPRRRTDAFLADSDDDTHGVPAGGVSLDESDVAAIAELLGLEATADVVAVELTAAQVDDLLALLDAEGDEEEPSAQVSAGADVQDVGFANWVSKAGGLPAYIRKIADALIREQAFTESRAIATAVNQTKRWCAGGSNVKPDTQAKACAAVASWNAKKAAS